MLKWRVQINTKLRFVKSVHRPEISTFSHPNKRGPKARELQILVLNKQNRN